jgi:hypothetical protein
VAVRSLLQQLEWNVLKITEETDKLTTRIVGKRGRDKLALTREKIIEARGWQPSLYLTKDNFERALKWIREGRVPAFRLGKTVRIDPHLLADMLQREVSDWEAKQELLDRRLKIIEKEGIAEDAACEEFAGEREGEE